MIPKPVDKWHMVTCATCHILVGWTRQEMTKPMYCIPHFDAVAHIPESDERRSTRLLLEEGPQPAETAEERAARIIGPWCKSEAKVRMLCETKGDDFDNIERIAPIGATAEISYITIFDGMQGLAVCLDILIDEGVDSEGDPLVITNIFDEADNGGRFPFEPLKEE